MVSIKSFPYQIMQMHAKFSPLCARMDLFSI